MASIFTKIINREIPAHIVAEDEKNLAFLDISPLTEGHTLVVPKKEIDYIYDLEDEDLIALHLFAKKVAKGLEKSVPCVRIGVTVIGLEVPHAHIHLIPMHAMGDMDFSNPKLNLSQSDLVATATKITEAIEL